MNRQSDPMRKILLSVCAVAVSTLTCSIAGAADKVGSPVERGRVIAQEKCARCHSIEQTGSSPLRVAPPFRDLGKRYPVRHLAEALAEGIVTGHNDMPVFTLEPRDIDALLTFMESLGRSAK